MTKPEVEPELQVPPAPIAIVAMGGHAFIRPGERGTYDDHVRNARSICQELMILVERGYRVVITHGNGPQVGDLLTRDEMTRHALPSLPLDVLVAQTEGSLGYYLQRALINEMHRRQIFRYVVTMVTQVLVSPDDPAFDRPTKPVGPFLSKEDAERYRDEFGWIIGEDKARGWRRLVPSPRPLKIVQAEMVAQAIRSGNIAITAGGGGIPVTMGADGEYEGIEAVIDKDLTAGQLGSDIGAELLVILTAVDGVYLNYGEPNATRLGAITMAECEGYIADGHFPAGSMGPKMQAVYEFLDRGGRRGLITSAEKLREALDGRAGTHVIGRI